MADSSISVEHDGLRKAGLNTDLVRDELNTLRTGGTMDLVRLPLAALGLIGMPAAIRHNMGVDNYAERLGHGAESADWLVGNLGKTNGSYLGANDAAIQALVARTARDSRDVHTDYSVIPKKLIAKDYSENWLGHSIPQSDLSDEQRYRLMEIGMGGAAAVGAVRVGAYLAELYGGSTAGRYSEMIKTRLSGARLLSPQILVPIAIFAAIAVRSDFEIDQCVSEWHTLAAWMSGVFGAGDPMKRDELARAWDSPAHDAADLKLRDFVTAGIQLTDRAVAKFDALRKAVYALNKLYKSLLYAATEEILILMGLSIAARFYPGALLIKERFATKIGITFAAWYAVLGVFYGWKMWHDMGNDSAVALPHGVANVDFPRGY
ncbi:hypothetical protein [Nonomuraea sediminis]|uniref:hypothetical protein n=1 Tax=Nonomuraea sediminis TaxID=2835864 RepID=UPI001BDC5737|nr:hypothetical protein [Nonomuraea sediminis]